MSRFASLRNAAHETATPMLSVLIPFYKESPLALLEALQTRDPHDVEIILIDDGSGMAQITADVAMFINASPMACELITLDQNEGRARGRNRLTTAARGSYFLFLDADMLPDGPGFLDRWLDATVDRPAAIFGGFTLLQAPDLPETAIHRQMAAKSDCLDAAARALQPEKYIFTSNLLIRRDVFETEGFDPAFTGWGWEDTEWGMRVAARYGVGHIDNTATHMGLDRAETLARKYEQSVANFARVIAKHPEVVATYPSYKVARMLKRVPGVSLLRPLLKAFALSPAPVRLRAFALRLYRAALYAKVV
ncbi:glycosyl transferase family 2 family protein [Asticcacaulis biprosthecium C19]|uniref:Glycosyl transferase family 2 family protein n=1 Tax=Asticcacaulis biprosthecium C19 TaxID=715226 RepID=F4QSX2_9CAUL|nr:glycosyltransferase family A protein [Asticcacaulis biprosthecium]EGF89842.1 glycosyl transferase family 2 family protein [Asticcacaulis biprosthecium C19]